RDQDLRRGGAFLHFQDAQHTHLANVIAHLLLGKRMSEFSERANDKVGCPRLHAGRPPVVQKDYIALRERRLHILFFGADDLQINVRHKVGDIAGAIDIGASADRSRIVLLARLLPDDGGRKRRETHYSQNGDTSGDSHWNSFELEGSVV